ncbi:transposase [Hymenobacter lapidiphilus]|nr:transposase [Hymenobacter sp. CCM 8763]
MQNGPLWRHIWPWYERMTRNGSIRCALFNAVRYLVKTGCGWRYLPHDLPPWSAVYQQGARWRDNRCFEHLLADLRELAR